MSRVLVVEDEVDVRNLMALHLERERYSVQSVENGEEALRVMQAGPAFDLVVLDWMLPGKPGLEVCREIRKIHGLGIGVLMVTARAEPSDIVLGLESGADDYVTKPFEIPVFLARVRALLRRSAEKAEPAQMQGAKMLQAGKLRVDVDRHEAMCSGKEVRLTPSEFKLLVALMHNQGKVLSRDRLIDLVQGEGVVVVDRAIDTHVFGLRKKLGPCAEFIETIRGVGYRVRAES